MAYRTLHRTTDFTGRNFATNLIATNGFEPNRLEHMNLYIALVIGKQAHQVREQIIIANKGRQRVDLAVAQIPNRHRLQRHIRIDRAGQQAPVERRGAWVQGRMSA